jgi:hypothetical protein
MKADVSLPSRSIVALTTVFTLVLAFVPCVAFAEGGIVDQSIDALYKLHDQLQDVVMKSVKPVAEAMQEGPPPNTDRPFSLDDLQQIRNKNADIVQRNNTLAEQQKQLMNINVQLLNKLPPDDPRRKAISDELKQVASQMPSTRKAIQDYTNKLNESDTAISQWKQRHDPTYVPPTSVTKTGPAASAAPEPPAEPPTTDDGLTTGGGGGGDPATDLATLKQKEADQEAAARALGQQRVSAVNKYLDDPSDDNRAEAAALKSQLDGMVDNLNGLRGQVDVLEGTSRPPIHVRSASGIAEEHRRRKLNGTNTDGSENTPASGGGGCARGGSEGNDASGGSYQDVGPSGSGGGSSSGASHHLQSHGMRKTNQSTGNTSSESHHHSTGKTHTGNPQNMQQQQQQQLKYHPAHQQTTMPQQQPQQQQHRRNKNGH